VKNKNGLTPIYPKTVSAMPPEPPDLPFLVASSLMLPALGFDFAFALVAVEEQADIMRI
jgi:hypothetical protein